MEEKVIQFKREGQTVAERRRELFLERLFSLPPEKALDLILSQQNAKELVQNLPSVDLYWIIKKIGEDDSIPLLELASEEQWQYILDIEVWVRDRINIRKVSEWLRRFMKADAERLARWLITEEMEMFTYYYLYRMLDIIIATDDNIYDIPEDYFTLDGTFYLKLRDPDQRDLIETILKLIASESFLRYQALLMTSRAILPASTEEELYRLRSVRIAEYGFLPFEEAVGIYAPLDPEDLVLEKKDRRKEIVYVDDEVKDIIPSFPMYSLQPVGIFQLALRNIKDNVLLDRIKLEFAGLCNQLLSADGLSIGGYEDLIKVCKKAAGYLNIGFEKVCGNDVNMAIELIKKNSLHSIFRVGFGIALRLRWEVERWIKESWFRSQKIDFSFWGSDGEILIGLLNKKPLYYVGIEDGEEYRPFQSLKEIEECRSIFYKIKVLDRLFSDLTSFYPIEKGLLKDPTITYVPFLFTFWARKILELDPGFLPIDMDQVRRFFEKLREKESQPPYRMEGFRERFIEDISCYFSGEKEEKRILNDILSSLWDEFREEYENVAIKDLDERYIRFILIR